MVQIYLGSDMLQLRDAKTSRLSLSSEAKTIPWSMFDLVHMPDSLAKSADGREADRLRDHLPWPLPALSELSPSYCMAVITKAARTWKFKEAVKFSKASVLVNLAFQ